MRFKPNFRLELFGLAAVMFISLQTNLPSFCYGQKTTKSVTGLAAILEQRFEEVVGAYTRFVSKNQQYGTTIWEFA